MTTQLSPFTGQTFGIDATASKPLVIDNFDPTQDSIQLAANPSSEVIPQFSFSDRYALTEIDGNTVISTRGGQAIAIVEGVTALQPFTSYTEKGTFSLVSLENDFFSTYIEPNFFEPWYSEFDKSDYGDSVQKAIDAGIVGSAYEHYLKFGQFEAREDSLFAPKSDGDNTLYGSGYENGLVGVPISEGVYTRDVKPLSTGVGEVDTLIGAPGEDTFFLGNAGIINEAPQPFYVGEGDKDYALIKNFDQGSTFGQLLSESVYYPDAPAGAREALTDRLLLAGKAYDYEFEKVGDDLKISFQDDLIALIEDAPPIDIAFNIPGGTYVYTTGNVATFDANSGWGSENTLYEPFYFENNPGVEEAIAEGEYASAFEHYVKVGQLNPESEVIFSGSSGDDVLTGFGAATLLFGVEVTAVNGEQEGYSTATTGVGEADFAVGGFGVDTFVIGNDNLLDPEKGSEVWYVGNGDEDYLTIQGFDPYKDFLFGAGDFADYTFEVLDETDDIFGRMVPYKSLEVNYQGDRVALISNIDGSLTLPDMTALQAFPLGDERPNGLALVAAENEFLPSEPPAGSEFFNDDLYLATFPEVAEFVKSGDYKSGLDYYTQVGQFEGEKLTEGFFTGTASNDTITGFGADSDLYGIGFDSIVRAEDGTVTLTPNSLGEGEIDVLQANADGFTGSYISAYQSFNFDTLIADTVPLYVGKGDADYARIKDLDPSNGYVAISTADFSEYTFKVDEEGFKTYYEGDLIGIAEGIYDLQVGFYEPSLELAALSKTTPNEVATGGFDEEAYLGIYPEVAQLIESGQFASATEHYTKVGQYEEGGGIHSGTSGNDTVISWTQTAEVRLSGVDFVADAPAGFENGQNYFGIKPASYGVGEVDTLVLSPDEGTISEALLGFFRAEDGSLQRFYVGEGSEDYALVKNFNPNDLDEIFLAGAPEDYTFEDVEGNLNIAYQGDLVGIVEGVTYDELELADEGEGSGAFVLIGKPESALPGLENFNGDFYIALNPDVVEFVGEGKPYETALDYYVAVGQFREDGGGHGFFDGSSGNDTLQGFGFDKDLFGVNYTSILGSLNTRLTLETETTGVGEIDTLVGSEGIDGFYAGAFKSVFSNEETGEFGVSAVPLYVGQGDQDYALMKDFDLAKDYLALAGDITDYEYEVVDGAFKVSKDGDLVAVVENAASLQPSFVEPGVEIFNFSAYNSIGFDEDLYLQFTPDAVAAIEKGEYKSGLEYYAAVGQSALTEEGEPASEGFFTGDSGNNTIIGFGQATGLSGVGLKARPDIDPAAVEFESTGTGEVDTLIGNDGENGFLLGSFVTPASPEQFVLYQGKGDEDYALIRNFKAEDSLEMAGKFEDYTLTNVDGDVKISYKGDLVAIVEEASDLEVLETFSDGDANYFTLGNKADIPTANEPLFGTTGDDTLALTAANQLVFAGAGNDFVDAITGQGNNRIYGGSGKDTFILGSGDSLLGDRGDDRFFAQTGGDNALTGGAGADQFWIASADIPESANTITDFTLGEDVIGLAGLGASFSSLTLTQEGDNALISFNDKDLVVLNQIQASSLSAANFAFA